MQMNFEEKFPHLSANKNSLKIIWRLCLHAVYNSVINEKVIEKLYRVTKLLTFNDDVGVGDIWKKFVKAIFAYDM